MTDARSTSLDGRVALVTGGARGIGAAIVKEFHARGAAVVVADNGADIAGNDADPHVVSHFVAELGDRAFAFGESIATPETAKACVDFAVSEFGGLDILVNNAAILRDKFIFKGDPGDWDAVIRNNLSAAFYLMAAATPVMRDQAKTRRGCSNGDGEYDWGRLIHLVSTAGIYGNYGQASYAAAKGGLISLSRVAALDLQRAGITSNAVVPFAHTRVTDMIQPANDAQAEYKERALKIEPHHVSAFVTSLCLPEAQSVSGQLFGVRGREVFLFSQQRPMASLADEEEDWTAESLAAALVPAFEDSFTPLETDLEAFNTEPLV